MHAHGAFVLGGTAAKTSAAALPMDEFEQAMAAIWSEVLRRGAQQPALARDAHFFLSGNARSPPRRWRRVADAWGIEFPVRLLFEQPRLQGSRRGSAPRARHRPASNT